ncbi:hypothetical protein ACFE04_012172 [Oxalis oulophora]
MNVDGVNNGISEMKEEDDDDDIDIVAAWLLEDDDDGVNELTKLLETADTTSNDDKRVMRFIDDPYSFSMIFQSSSGYVTINGNEESCGSSFSESYSSLMANLHMPNLVVMSLFGAGAWDSLAHEEERNVNMNVNEMLLLECRHDDHNDNDNDNDNDVSCDLSFADIFDDVGGE